MKIISTYDFHKKLAKNIEPAMSYKGGDILNWQEDAKENLSELLGLDKIKKCADNNFNIEYETSENGVKEIRFTFQSEEGYNIPCHMLIPENVEKPPFMICLQGHSKGMHVSLGVEKHIYDRKSIENDSDFARRAVKEGFAAVAMEQRNFGELSYDLDMGWLPPCTYSGLSALTLGRTTVGERVWDVMRLIDLLFDKFSDKFDFDNLGCMGNSGGGTATAYAGALDERIKISVTSCAMCAFDASINAVPHCVCNYIPKIAEYFEMGDLITMTYPRKFVQVSGIEDKDFPIEGCRRVFNEGKKVYFENGKSDKCIMVEGNGGHRFYADSTWPHIHKLTGK